MAHAVTVIYFMPYCYYFLYCANHKTVYKVLTLLTEVFMITIIVLFLLNSRHPATARGLYHCGYNIRNILSGQRTFLRSLRTRVYSNDVGGWSSLLLGVVMGQVSKSFNRRKRRIPSRIVSGSLLLLSLLGLSRLSFRLRRHYFSATLKIVCHSI